MGKKGNKKESSGFRKPTTLREEITGRKQLGGGSANDKRTLKIKHLKNLAVWASGEGSVPSLAAFFGNRLATCAEAAGTPLDQSVFACNRCETVLQPGNNCTVRIEKSSIPTQNDVVYTCHFCSNRNIKRGTPKGHMKEILGSKPKPVSEAKPIFSAEHKSASSETVTESCLKIDTEDMTPSKNILSSESKSYISTSPATPTERGQTLLSLGKKRKKSGLGRSKKQVGSQSESVATNSEKKAGGSSRKRRKSWTSLKEIAEENERKNSFNLTNVTVPFIL